MLAARLLDVLLVLILVIYVVAGWRRGFVRSLSAILGIIAGGVAAFFAVPLLTALIPDPFWRIAVSLALSLALLIAGHAAGVIVGGLIRGKQKPSPLTTIDRVFGALANLVVAALVVSLVAGSVSAMGVPFLTKAAADSIVLRGIEDVTPPPVEDALARMRSAVLEEGLPAIQGALGGITANPTVPPVATGTPALDRAAASVVRISGTAYACGQNQSGSGFVIAKDRLITNAHVVAGVKQPVVQAPNGQALDGRVVYFDPNADLAVIAVTGLSARALSLSGPLSSGTDAVVDGYPHGGPFETGAARVLATSDERIDNIYGTAQERREVYTVAADIEPGNSGGPLLATSGKVAGIVFARSADHANVGYAMTDTELSPVVTKAAKLSAPVSSGRCIKG